MDEINDLSQIRSQLFSNDTSQQDIETEMDFMLSKFFTKDETKTKTKNMKKLDLPQIDANKSNYSSLYNTKLNFKKQTNQPKIEQVMKMDHKSMSDMY